LNATAVGVSANASAAGSVALGGGSVADRANTVSVGSAVNNRQVTNVANGTEINDAVNRGQLDAVAFTANTTNRYFRANGTGTANAIGTDSVAMGLAPMRRAHAASRRVPMPRCLPPAHWPLAPVRVRSASTRLQSVLERVRWMPMLCLVGSGNPTDGPATRRIVNVADGRIAAGSSDAVTGSQLNVTNQRVGAVETRVGDFDSRIATVETTAGCGRLRRRQS
jgi:autotransporter adhesin